MIRMAIIAASLIAMGTTPALAAPCRGAGGKFIKCATAAPAKPTRCKAANGKFAKCGTPGAKPI
jgi:hypothetical protein